MPTMTEYPSGLCCWVDFAVDDADATVARLPEVEFTATHLSHPAE